MQTQTKIEMSAWPKTKPTDKSPWQPEALKVTTEPTAHGGNTDGSLWLFNVANK